MPWNAAVPLVLQIGVPLLLLAWQAFGRDTNIVTWCLKHGAVWTYIYATSIAGLWLVAPWYVPHTLMVVSISLGCRTLYVACGRRLPSQNCREWITFAASAGAAIVGIATLSVALQGRRPPAGPTVELTFPLRSGEYYVANGGSNELVNAHVRMLSSVRFRAYRASGYAVDIVKLNRFGNRSSGFAPHDPAQYAIFTDAIYAPCEGVVIRVEDWLPDLAPPQVDRAHMPGNFVLLECGDAGEFHVLLAHMQRGSVRVHPGDYVTPSMKLAEVGNSGNSDEPHLHIHAQRPGHVWDLFNGDPLPIRFDGRYLIRNDRVTRTAAAADVIDD